jgi:diphosphoinositol-polyphosphate diphosphatase
MTKVKIAPEDRIYDVDGYWLRAACVCIRDDSEAEVLLVSSSACPDRWIIPGGKIQREEAAETSAMREAKEEAGVVGCLGRCLGVFDNNERRHRTKVFVLRVHELLDCYEDKGLRKRAWFSIEEAARLLLTYKPLHCKYLAALRQIKAAAVVEENNGSYR